MQASLPRLSRLLTASQRIHSLSTAGSLECRLAVRAHGLFPPRWTLELVPVWSGTGRGRAGDLDLHGYTTAPLRRKRAPRSHRLACAVQLASPMVLLVAYQ